ncbi:hypothetical protein AVEN_154261-1 [Araneus ventricosus]|uniref:Uncharacterized protein n=1 Tax=Araneus ventricosus TaxID=182803 RepID=A0A4Y2JLT4_ARAVE|nr:hypothetical protein AVEN_154261-1 [Araneus ventricosus]
MTQNDISFIPERTNPLLRLCIRISDSESESANPNRNQQIRIHGFTHPIPRIRSFQRLRSFWSESDSFVPFEESDPRIRSGVNDTSLLGIPTGKSPLRSFLCEIVHFVLLSTFRDVTWQKKSAF